MHILLEVHRARTGNRMRLMRYAHLLLVLIQQIRPIHPCIIASVPHFRRQRVSAGVVHTPIFQARLLLTSETRGGTRAEQHADQTAEESAGD